MATAEELLDQAAESGVVTEDAKSYLTVDLHSRQIAIPATIKNLGVESDDEVLRLHFKVPRYYDEVDLSEFAIRVNYTNANGDEDVYGPMDITFTDDDITFSWLVGRYAVIKSGNVIFSVCMKDYTNDGVTVDREFNTTPTSLPVLKGHETSEAVVEEERDALAAVAEEAVKKEREYIDGCVDNRIDELLQGIEDGLDAIIALQNTLIGGDTV